MIRYSESAYCNYRLYLMLNIWYITKVSIGSENPAFGVDALEF